jgi:hypothetical protein
MTRVKERPNKLAKVPPVTSPQVETLLATTAEVAVELEGLESEIRGLVKQTLENVVRLGEIFIYIKDNLLPAGQWQKWLKQRFNNEISQDTAKNFMKLYTLYKEYESTHGDGLKALDLASLYRLGSDAVEPAAKETALELAAEQPMNRRTTAQVIQTYRKIKLAHAGLAPEAVKLLTKVEVAEDPKQLRDMQRMSKTTQVKVAGLIAEGLAETPKEAIQVLKSSKQIEDSEALEDTDETVTVEVDYTKTKRFSYNSLADVPAESVKVALVEAPLRFDYVETRLHDLSNELERVLVPGGFAIITVGHKAIMYAGGALGNLNPLHVLCLRRQPGNTRTIIGVNIACASVLAVLAYKGPYNAPKGMIADLQTIDQQAKHITESEAIEGFDAVHTGLEKCFEVFLNPLLESGDSLLHLIVSKDHFNINDHLFTVAENNNCAEFTSVTSID